MPYRLRKVLAPVLLTALFAAAALAQTPAVPLFNGRDLTGWIWTVAPSPPAPSWSVEDGILRTTPGRGTEVYLLTRDSFTDYDLSFEWNGDAACNSGVKYRFQGYWVDGKLEQSPGGRGRIEPVALEYQITDDERNHDALSDPKHSAGALYEYWPPTKPGPAKAGVWHASRIVVQGLHIEHWLDGVRVVDIKLDSPEVQESFRRSQRHGSSPVLAKQERRTSPIALQMHDGVVRFRNIRIRRL